MNFRKWEIFLAHPVHVVVLVALQTLYEESREMTLIRRKSKDTFFSHEAQKILILSYCVTGKHVFTVIDREIKKRKVQHFIMKAAFHYEVSLSLYCHII